MPLWKGDSVPLPACTLYPVGGQLAGSEEVSSPEPSLGQLGRCVAWPCWMLALPRHADLAKGRGSPEDPELAREAHLPVDGRCLAESPQLFSWQIGPCP